MLIPTKTVRIGGDSPHVLRRSHMKRIVTFALAAVLALVVASPAFAATGAGGAGRDFGEHHATHAQEIGGFTGTENPGVMHKGFSGWTGV
jgi:hypothetical protein